MQSLNPRFIIVPLFIFLILFGATSHEAEPKNSDDEAVYKAVVALVIYQVKAVLIKQLAPGDIEEMINHVRDIGATGYKLNYYSGGKMGWSMEDSKGKEVYSAIFSFLGRRAKEGIYFGPLISFPDAKVVHNWHIEALSDYFKRIGVDKYDINDDCVAIIELFRGTAGSGRTIITIEYN